MGPSLGRCQRNGTLLFGKPSKASSFLPPPPPAGNQQLVLWSPRGHQKPQLWSSHREAGTLKRREEPGVSWAESVQRRWLEPPAGACLGRSLRAGCRGGVGVGGVGGGVGGGKGSREDGRGPPAPVSEREPGVPRRPHQLPTPGKGRAGHGPQAARTPQSRGAC